MKLNLGCRNNILEGYANIDFDNIQIKIDNSFQTKDAPETSLWKMNIMDIDKYFKAGTVSEIVATHFFEHLTHQQITILMYKLWCLLKENGTLTITTPDFHALINMYKKLHEKKDFSDVDILHIKMFDTEEESFHKTVWYEEIGVYYLEREHFFEITEITHPSEIEVKFVAVKLS